MMESEIEIELTSLATDVMRAVFFAMMKLDICYSYLIIIVNR